ncbi:MAG: FG-GAP-like repeat-containing protein [Candidatus Cloacimonas sp.]|nr:FG-GAP-like repeat-containing protein [Candidatus Cloacimonadota bacterium]
MNTKKIFITLITLTVFTILNAQFTSVTNQAFPEAPKGAWSVAWIDINNDGLLDAFIAPYYFYLNNGDGTFTPRDTSDLDSYGIGSDTRVSFADANGNGYIDMVITEHIHTTPTRERHCFYFENSGPPDYKFTGEKIYTLPLNVKGGQPMFVDVTGNGKMDIYITLFGNWEPDHGLGADRLFSRNNQGNWYDATGIYIPQLNLPQYKRASRGVNSCDFDMDFDIDIFVPVYVIAPSNPINMLWVNDGTGRFFDKADEAGVAIEPHGRDGYGLASGAAFGDFNNNGWFDLAVANIHGWAAVYENNQDGTFTNITEETGLFTDGPEKQWHNVNWIDYDNDGWLDLWLTQWYGDEGYFCYVFENQGPERPGYFVDVTEKLGFTKFNEFNEVMGLAAGDYDGDGFLDILFYTSAGYRPEHKGVHLFKNNGNDNNWLQVDLVGSGVRVGKTAVGSQARIFYKDGTASYIKQVETTSSDQSMHQLPLHFGLGKQNEIQQIMVRWIDGKTEYWRGEDIGGVNKKITLEYGAGSPHSSVIYVDIENEEYGDGSNYNPYSSLARAIDLAPEGSIVNVAPGEYLETLDFGGKGITVVNQGKPEETILMGSYPGSPAVAIAFTGEKEAILDGFTIHSGWGQGLSPGGLFIREASPVIKNCVFTNNTASNFGGAIGIEYATPTFINCHIVDNQAISGGGGISASFSDVTLIGTIVEGNSAASGSAIRCLESNLNLINSVIINNSASEQGVIHLEKGSLNIDFSNILDNNSGIFMTNTPTEQGWIITNSIIQNNGDQDFVYDTEPSITYCNTTFIQEGDGNISADPAFLDHLNGDWRLAPFSSCIGAGRVTGVDYDMDNNKRPQPEGSNPDIGCYEHELGSPISSEIYVATAGNDETGDGSESNPYKTINYAITKAVDRQTIVVTAGTYKENVKFNGKNCRVVSKYEHTENKIEIINTIIDGGGENPTVQFTNNESSLAELKGFTITNGKFSNGGGIRVADSNPTLSHLRIVNNVATTNGAGIFLQNSEAILRDIYISDNQASNYGAGLTVMNSNPTLERIDINNNSANSNGGFATINSTVVARHFTVADNVGKGSSSVSGGVLSVNSHIYMINSILWGNEPEQIGLLGNGSVNVFYSDVQDGFYGTGNINVDPQFLSAENKDYRLNENSPCRNAGIAKYSQGNLELIDLQEGTWSGSAPDMGAYDYMFTDVEKLLLPQSDLRITAAPNPFNPSTKISFNLPEKGYATLTIYNIKGQEVTRLVEDNLNAGSHSIIWNGKDSSGVSLSSGVYMIKLASGKYSATNKILLLK